MTYVANTPLSTDSPGIFPAQAQANFARLQTLFAADHQFNNTMLGNDGWHNLIHMTEQVPLPAIASTGQLYAKSASGVTQLFYTDSAGTEHQITPESSVSSTLIVGSATILNSTTKALILADPGYDYTGTLTVYVNSSSTFVTYSVIKTGGSTGIVSIATNGSLPVPIAAFGGFPVLLTPPLTNLIVSIIGVGPLNITWTLNINRTT